MAWTTEDVRRWFIIAAPVDDARGEFDAWLAAHDAEVARAAAERGWSEGARATEAFYLSRDPQRRKGDVLPIPTNPYRKPEPPDGFVERAKQAGREAGERAVSEALATAAPAPSLTIRKEDSNG